MATQIGVLVGSKVDVLARFALLELPQERLRILRKSNVELVQAENLATDEGWTSDPGESFCLVYSLEV